MQSNDYAALAVLRLERARELLIEAEDLLKNEHYKSANNRAYYVIEKSINALLAIDGVMTKTHKGCLLLFNKLYVRTGKGGFSQEDYKQAAKAEEIRSVSDYDDFYIANKKETREIVEFAGSFYKRVDEYIELVFLEAIANKRKDSPTIPFEDIVKESGFTMDELRKLADEVEIE
ncbi:HEPN domain-containing protein [Pseudobutyrivibrio xylanivorans]|uniref:Uncharacterized protein, contains HEPN domain, UPF0332 family n=1 Tax=Pseudobutyrivibrio xylanivorans TaxID=185007 RepID=A0A1G5RUN6_PSEXY|nr:HEPN domain-containing protein [Pseudobutyrivibrio xylanivorans]SCZ77726.1 Uncharacterized protein, contains HEPN domain, UPF0332 family [Pseudobutyrivibrio xylanivorans]